jgi:hypothetical protein
MQNRFANYVGRKWVLLTVLVGVSAVVGCPSRPAVVSSRAPVLTLTLNNDLNIEKRNVESPVQLTGIAGHKSNGEIDRTFVKSLMDELASEKKPSLIVALPYRGESIVYVAHSIKAQKVEFRFSLDVPVMIENHLIQDSIPLECGVHAFKLTFSDDHVDVEHSSDPLHVIGR